jgi:hypothetical protein
VSLQIGEKVDPQQRLDPIALAQRTGGHEQGCLVLKLVE